jgi:3-phenylpropionate/trans-cinnamate dioxygenase ferredoxin subunit
MAFETVTTTDDLPPGERIVVDIDDIWVAIFNVDGQFYAIEDVCTHDYGPLGEGLVIGKEVECPRHGATFNLETGKATFPAVKPVARYAVQVSGDDVQVDVTQRINKPA